MNYLILMMGGKGTRLGADRPKQYIEIDGIPIFAYILKSYNQVECIDEIVIVSNEMWIEYVEKWISLIQIDKPLSIVAGGKTRSHSVYNGLKSLSDRAEDDDIVWNGEERLNLSEDTRILPWGWSPALCHQLKQAGVQESLLPSAKELEQLRQLSHRQTAVTLLKELSEELPLDGHFAGESTLCHNI